MRLRQGSGKVRYETITFDLYYSEDGSTWTKIDSYSSSAGEEEYQVFSFDRVNARYIKLVGNGCSANVNTNILEFRVLKKKAEFEHAVRTRKTVCFP